MPDIVIDEGDTTEDKQPVIQQALDALAASGGGTVYIESGDYYIGLDNGANGDAAQYSLQIGNNTTLEMADDCRLIKRFATENWQAPLIRNKDQVNGNSNIRVVGGTVAALDPLNLGRMVVFIKVTNVTMERTKFRGVYLHWNFTAHDCNNVVCSHLDIDSGRELFEDGLHFSGCQDVDVHDCRIICGDDAIALDNVASTTQDMLRVRISNCQFNSVTARAVRITIDPGVSYKIADVRVYDCTGACGGGGVSIDDQNLAYQISNVSIDGMTLDCSTATTVGSYPLSIVFGTRITIANFTAYSPYEGAIVNAASDVDLINLKILTPRQASQYCLGIAVAGGDCTNIRVRGGHFTGAQFSAIHLGSLFSVTNFEISGALINGQGITPNGIELWYASHGMVSGNTIIGCKEWGIYEYNGCSYDVFLANRLLGNTLGGLFMDGPTSQAARNLTDPGKPNIDSGGFRQTIDGWISDGGLTALTNVEIPRNNFAVVAGAAGAGRFRAVRPGSVTGIVLTSDVNQASGTLTATVYINRTGFAGGPGSPTGLSAQLDGTNQVRRSATQPEGTDTFLPGDEIYIVISTSTAPPDAATWTPTDAKIRCALEIED